MKHNYLIGLGGSGGKIIAELYKRLIAERGSAFDKDIECIAIDTDQEELSKLSELGVKKICISGKGNVGEYYNSLGDDVGEWCPNTSNEGNFFSSQLFNGASQCRFKSRLCFADFLKDDNNELARILENSRTVDSTGNNVVDEPPKVLIASSIAGGTGSGIFIQTALYIKKFFKQYNIPNVIVHGLFACPDLYKGKVPAAQLTNIYANAYAVIRELNALNLICGPEKTTAYGGKLDIDIEISTNCEGKLFEKDSAGRYGDKPYDLMYFIDKVNSLSTVLGGLPEYYKAMANIAYSHLYTAISGAIHSKESNELNFHNMAPGAIYGSAGAASIKYPYEDIVKYFANRSIKESFDDIWTELDRKWASYYREKEAAARSNHRKYIPAPGERADHFIENFDKSVKTTGMSTTKLSFLAPMVERDNKSAVEALMDLIKANAKAEIDSDNRIKNAKAAGNIDNINSLKESLLSQITGSSGLSDSEDMFAVIKDIDQGLDEYCKQCIKYAADIAISFSNKIICEDIALSDVYDESNFGIINGLLYDRQKGEWVHPVAARYLLYLFKKKVDEKVKTLIGSADTPADDAEDFYNYMVNEYVIPQRQALSSSDEDVLPNADILQSMADRLFGKRAAKAGVEEYFESLEDSLHLLNDGLVNALLYFSFVKVSDRLSRLVTEYEVFFDNIDDFVKKAESASSVYETMHDKGKGILYVCASAEAKRRMYDNIGGKLDTQTGKIASNISNGLFKSLRLKAVSANENNKKKSMDFDSFFNCVSDIVAEGTKKNTEINTVLDKNIFSAILYEYDMLCSDESDLSAKYNDNGIVKNKVDAFILSKLSGLTRLAAPLLVYDASDTYSGMFDTQNEKGEKVQKPKVSNAYRFFSHNADVAASILELIGSTETVPGFYSFFASRLPKDTEKQSIEITYVDSDSLDKYTMICYSTVHCLQPYQINAFDEIKGGVYYQHYSKRIADMESVQKYSMSPHLDKRWHKHGVMPYINVAKEVDRRHDLAKAFLYALCYGKLGYNVDGSDERFVFGDNRLGMDPAVIYHKGRSVPYHKINRAMYWFADQEALIERYASLFDEAVEAEIEKLSEYSETVANYKINITNQARILNQLKRNILRAINVTGSKNGKAKKLVEKDKLNILDLAWKLHISEENEIDKDYGELLVSALCNVIDRYAKGPYNKDDIESKNKGSEAYINYLDVREHIAKKFINAFAMSVAVKLKDEETLAIIANGNGDEEAVADAAKALKELSKGTSNSANNQTADETGKKKTGAFGRDETDLNDNEIVVKGTAFGEGDAVARDKSFRWASTIISEFVKE